MSSDKIPTVDRGSHRLEETIPDWGCYLLTATQLATSTQKRYLYELRLFVTNANNPVLRDVTPELVQQWYYQLQLTRLAPGTLGQKLGALRSFFGWLYDVEQYDPAGRVLRSLSKPRHLPSPKHVTGKPHVVLTEPLELLLEAANTKLTTRDRALVHLLATTDLTSLELSSLCLEHLDLDQCSVRVVSQNGQERLVSFDDTCRNSLVAWLDESDGWPVQPDVEAVFLSAADGKPLSVARINQIAREAGKEAKRLRRNPRYREHVRHNRGHLERMRRELLRLREAHPSVESQSNMT